MQSRREHEQQSRALSLGTVRLICTLWAIATMVACTTDLPANRAPAASAQRVLVLSPVGAPAVDQLVAALAAGGQGSPPLPPTTADVVWVEDVAQAVAAVQKLKPQIGRYRAIYSTSLTFARAAQLAITDVPIVFEGVDDPMTLCLVDSLKRPGRNATGYMHYLPDDEFKMLDLLRDAFPALREALFLVSGDNLPPPNCDPEDAYWKSPPKEPCVAGERDLDSYVQRRVRGAELTAHAQLLGLRLRFVVSCSTTDFADLGRVAAGRADAGWVVPWQSLFDENRAPLVARINATDLPAIYPHHGYTRIGGLMSLAPLLDDGPDRVSVLTLLKVLGGANPATLPVQSPRGFSFVINARAAGQLPTRPSLLVLRRADEIVR